MTQRLEEIHATYHGERFRFENASGDVIIADAEIRKQGEKPDPLGTDWTTIKGESDLGELIAGQDYRFFGKWSNYKNKRTGETERQFAFRSFVPVEPAGEKAICLYLAEAGKGNGIGYQRALKIYRKLGEDSIRIAREQPETIQSITGVTLDRCERMAEWLDSKKKLEQVTLRVNSLLAGRGFPKSTAKKAIKAWGNAAETIIKKDPYRLMSFTGCGFKLCDQLYLSLGHRIDRLRRQAYCAWYACASNTDGHTWFPVDMVARFIVNNCGQGADPFRAIKLARKIAKIRDDRHGALAISREACGAVVPAGGSVFVAEGRKANKEILLARMVAEATREMHDWPSVDEIEGIDDHQREQLEKAIQGPIAILGGSPGTGKTYASARLIKQIIETFGQDEVAVASPTGKASVRITEAMQENGVDITAKTWHSLLGVGEVDPVTGVWSFKHCPADPLPYKVIIGDESSMIDTDLMAAIFRARARGTMILLVGDINQLPPVGHGAPLRDFIAAGLPYGELTEIKRNSGGIVEACAAIRDGKKWIAGDNLAINETPNQSQRIIDLLHESTGEGFDPVWDCQVLVAVNEKSPLSRKELNKILQAELNANPKQENKPFREADKVVCLKNGFFPLADNFFDGYETDDESESNDDGEVYVANGELAEIVDVKPKYYIAKLSSPDRTIRIPCGENGGCSFDLGYALSCHKSQGSEWPVVIVAIDDYPGARMICDRSWLFTAISRAKKKCHLVGKKSVADSFCRRTKIDKRKTFLRQLIKLEQAKKGLAGL